VVWEIEGTRTDAIQALFSSMKGIKKLIAVNLDRATVLIKPNLCLPHPNKMGTTTSTQVVDALCEFLVTSGVKRIIIADHTLKKSSDFKKAEILQVVDKYSEVTLLLANEKRFFQPIKVNGKALKTTDALSLLPQADLLINLATAKHHSATRVSLAIKNLMGLIWNRAAFHTRLGLSQAIADLALAIRPGLNIIDASRVLLNRGPVGPGPVISENRLFAGFDILALDAVVVSRYEFGGKSLSAHQVPHLRAASQNGIGQIDIRKIKVEKIRI